MDREVYSAYIADGFADDCEELIHRCTRVLALSYTNFCTIYKDMKFDGLYNGRSTAAEIAELSEEILHVAKHYMVTDTSNFEESVAGLFLVYVLLNTQPFPMFAALRLTPDDIAAINRIQIVARREKRFDVLYILGHVLIKGPCQLHATAREYGLEPALRKYFGKTATMDRKGLRPKGVFQRQNEELDNIRELRNLDRRYCANKARLPGGSTDHNLNFWDKGFVNWLDTSLRKLVDGITEDGTSSVHERTNHLNAIRERAMKVPVNSVGHLTGVNEKAQKSTKTPNPTMKQFVLPRSPAKTTRKKNTSRAHIEWEVPVVNDETTKEKDNKELSLAVYNSNLRARKAQSSGTSSQDKNVTDISPTDNIEYKCRDMMIIDDSDDEIRHVNNNKKMVSKDNTQKTGTVVYVIINDKMKGENGMSKENPTRKRKTPAINKGSKKNMHQEKPGKKRKITSKLSKKKKVLSSSESDSESDINKGSKKNDSQEKPSKKRKMSLKISKKKKVLSSSDSDSESDIELDLDDSEDDLYSVTDDIENLTETIDDDIKRVQHYSEIEKPENDIKSRRRYRTRKSETFENFTETIDSDLKKLEENTTPKNSENYKQSEITSTKNNSSNKTETGKQSESRQSRMRKNETNVQTNIENEDSDNNNRKNIDESISQNLGMGAPKKTKVYKSESRRSTTSENEADLSTNVVYEDRELNETPKDLDNQPESRQSGSRKNEKDIEIETEKNNAPKNHDYKNKKDNIRPRTRESETDLSTHIVNEDNPDKSRKSVDEMISQNLVIGAPLLIQTDKVDEFIQISIVDSMDESEQNKKETVDEKPCLRTRQVKTTNSPGNNVNSPKTKPTSPDGNPSSDKSPLKKENRLKKQNELFEKQNPPKTRSNLKDTNVPLTDENKKSPKIKSNENNIQKSPKTSDNSPKTPIGQKQKSPKKKSNENYKRNSPKTPGYLGKERFTRSSVKEGHIETILPDNVTISKIDENKSKTMPPHSTSKIMSPGKSTPKIKSPGQSALKTMSPGQSTSKTLSPCRTPRAQSMDHFTLECKAVKRKAPESKVRGTVKSKLKRMGILHIIAKTDEVCD